MTHEIIHLNNVQIIGISKEIAFNKGFEECPKFWDEYVQRIIKPVFMEGKTPDAFQAAAIRNNVGEYALCTCNLPSHNCTTCATDNFQGGCCNSFTYVIGGFFQGGDVPEGMQLYPIHTGRWLKVHFEGGMKAFQQQYVQLHNEFISAHPEFHFVQNGCSMEWYCGQDINAPDYQCGVMMPLTD